jgi:hypothetical protein
MVTPQGQSVQEEIARLQREVTALRMALRTLIVWMAQSANSPIRVDEASRLLNMMNDRL